MFKDVGVNIVYYWEFKVIRVINVSKLGMYSVFLYCRVIGS